MGIQVEFYGLDNLPKSGVILAPNHESMFDILVMASIPYDFSWLSKEEVGRIPFIGQSMKAMGCFFVRRDRSGGDMNVMKELETAVRDGRSVLIFPEGTRTRTGELLPLKKGAFRTAQNAGVPLIPIAIQGTRAIAKPGELPTRGHRVRVMIGRPFPVPAQAELAEVMEKFRLELTKLLAENSSLR